MVAYCQVNQLYGLFLFSLHGYPADGSSLSLCMTIYYYIANCNLGDKIQINCLLKTDINKALFALT